MFDIFHKKMVEKIERLQQEGKLIIFIYKTDQGSKKRENEYNSN